MKAKTIILIAAGAVVLLFAGLETAAVIVARPKAAPGPLPADVVALESQGPAKLEADAAAVQKKLEALVPKGNYIVIDTARNVLVLRKGDQVVRQAVVSCGSGSVLEEPGGKRKWIFDTPRGEFQVKSKLLAPTWIKPDWAFIEEGEKPPQSREERKEEGVLGDYALGFGNDFFIHGTLYTRLLGRNVTHGCVRVGDDDLKALYKAAPLGTKIFIF